MEWGRERDTGEKERGIQGRKREREREREGERKKFMEFYLVVLQSGYHKILTIQSLYRYIAVIELTKIFKFGHPKSLLETFELSSRNNRNLIIVSTHKNSQFHYQSSVMWNSLLKPLKVPSVHQIDINIFKHKFRKYLLKQQEIGDETAWTNANNQR